MDSPTLTNALTTAKQTYTHAHPLSYQTHLQACKYLPGGNTRTVLHTSPFPFTVLSASSSHITTVDGLTYTDFLGEYTAGIYGHNHPVIRAAIEKALDGGWNYGAHGAAEAEFAGVICERFPVMEKVRFVNSGTEANMMALGTAVVVAEMNGGPGKRKRKVLVFEKGYHGSTISGRMENGKPSINLPHEFVVGRYNDVEGTRELVGSLEGNSLAAILVEPMLGSGGCYAASQEFLETLRALATEHNALLIFDEVMTSRLGKHGFAAQYGVKPDMMTLGKYIGGGMSFGAFGGRDDIMALYDPRTGQLEHPGTYNNNVFTCHAGIAGCKLLTDDVLAALNGLGDSMRARIEDVLDQHGILADGRVPSAPVADQSMHKASNPSRPPKMFMKGVGSLMCVHFSGYDRELLQGLFYHHMLEQGIYIAQRGFIALSIEIRQADVDKSITAVDMFCQQRHSALLW